MYTLCNEKYIVQAKDLFHESFGDDASYVTHAFESCGNKNILLDVSEDEVRSLLFMLPFSLCGREGHYVFGACTKKEHRGKGLMTQLLQEAAIVGSKRGDAFSFLLPANESLFEFYRERGYVVPFFCSYDLLFRANSEEIKLYEADQEKLNALRTQAFGKANALIQKKEANEMAYFDVVSSGGKVLTDGVSYGVCYPENGGLFVKELYTIPENGKQFADTLMSIYGVDMCTVQGIAYENQYLLGLLQWLDEPIAADIYGNLLLD